MIVEAIRQVVESRDLSRAQAEEAMDAIMTGRATDAQIAALVTALRMKGETDEEIAGFASVMRSHAAKVEAKSNGLVDTCGTGGDNAGTFNISTASALVAAAAGAKIAKHGNRSISSRCGSADVLEALGVQIELGPAGVASSIDETGFGFMFAPIFHGAMKYAKGPRHEIGIRTVFNILGPLTNPAGADYQVIGVYDERLTAPMARVLGQLGSKRALVVHGFGGLDEISLSGPTTVSELSEGHVETRTYQPADFGCEQIDPDELHGGDAKENADIIRGILGGTITGAKAEIVFANAGAALTVSGIAADLIEGTGKARQAVGSGEAEQLLGRLVSRGSGT